MFRSFKHKKRKVSVTWKQWFVPRWCWGNYFFSKWKLPCLVMKLSRHFVCVGEGRVVVVVMVCVVGSVVCMDASGCGAGCAAGIKKRGWVGGWVSAVVEWGLDKWHSLYADSWEKITKWIATTHWLLCKVSGWLFPRLDLAKQWRSQISLTLILAKFCELAS